MNSSVVLDLLYSNGPLTDLCLQPFAINALGTTTTAAFARLSLPVSSDSKFRSTISLRGIVPNFYVISILIFPNLCVLFQVEPLWIFAHRVRTRQGRILSSSLPSRPQPHGAGSANKPPHPQSRESAAGARRSSSSVQKVGRVILNPPCNVGYFFPSGEAMLCRMAESACTFSIL